MASSRRKTPKVAPIANLSSPLAYWLKGRPVVLASKSPRRRELLRQIGIDAVVVPSNIDEEQVSHEGSFEKQIIQLANLKAQAVAKHINQGLIIGADTVVVTDSEVLEKPKSLADARRMITTLSGDSHFVVTGMTLIAMPEARSLSGVSRTRVRFTNISKYELQTYVDYASVLDKAGGYGIQDMAGVFVEGIEGSYSNVVGLPLELLRTLTIQLLTDETKGMVKPGEGSSLDLK